MLQGSICHEIIVYVQENIADLPTLLGIRVSVRHMFQYVQRLLFFLLTVSCPSVRGLGLRSMAVLGITQRGVQSSAPLSAGQDWRIRHGFARDGSEYGPLTDLPDWSFADGRPGTPWKGQIRRKAEREAFARRVVLFSSEMEQGIKKWKDKQQALNDEQLHKEKIRLKHKAVHKKTPKG
uniref:Large ribosomal subunit protein mL52 n=1 Tax=Leptobrachium leishanense TaxID=445787 RepID=A0A8C5MLV1_9ANUR